MDGPSVKREVVQGSRGSWGDDEPQVKREVVQDTRKGWQDALDDCVSRGNISQLAGLL